MFFKLNFITGKARQRFYECYLQVDTDKHTADTPHQDIGRKKTIKLGKKTFVALILIEVSVQKKMQVFCNC